MEKNPLSDVVRIILSCRITAYPDATNMKVLCNLAESIRISHYSVDSDGLKLKEIASRTNLCKKDLVLSLEGDKGTIAITFTFSDGTSHTSHLYAIRSKKGVYITPYSYERTERLRMQNEMSKQTYLRQTLNIPETPTTKIASQRRSWLRSPIKKTTIQATFLWRDSASNTHPLQQIKVVLFSKSFSPIASAYTDQNGSISVTINDYDLSFVYVICSSCTPFCTVADSLKGNPYTTIAHSGKLSTGETFTIDDSTTTGRALQITQAYVYGYNYGVAMSDAQFKVQSIPVVYPNEYKADKQTSYCTRDGSSIHIYETAYLSWDILLHEFGHMIQHAYGITNNPGGAHKVHKDAIIEQNSKDNGIRLAWGEAWPTVFAIMVTQYYNLSGYPHVNDLTYDANNGSSSPTIFWKYSLESNEGWAPLGEGSEKFVSQVLYDMYDATSEAGKDNMQMSHKNFWKLVTSSNAKTFSDFAAYAIKTVNYQQFAEILEANKMSSIPEKVVDDCLQLTMGGNPASPESLQNKLKVKYVSGYTHKILDTVTYEKLDLFGNKKNQTKVKLPLNKLYNDPGANFRVAVASWQTSQPVTGPYYSVTRDFEKPKHVDGTYFIATDDFSDFSQRTSTWASKSVMIAGNSFTLEALNACYDKSVILTSEAGKASTSSVAISTSLPIYCCKYTVMVKLPHVFPYSMISGSVVVTVKGTTLDDKEETIGKKVYLGKSIKYRKSDIVSQDSFSRISKLALKKVTITVSSKLTGIDSKKVQVSLGNFVIDTNPIIDKVKDALEQLTNTLQDNITSSFT